MKTLSGFLNRIASWKNLLVLIALYAVFPGYFLKNAKNTINELAGKRINVIDLTIGFNPQKTLTLVSEYGDAARAYYATNEMTVDVVYPIVYAFLFGIILSLLYRTTAYAWVNVLPFFCMLFDYGENATIVNLLRTYPQQSVVVATFCEIFKLFKWVSLGVVMLLVGYGLLMLFMKLMSQRERSI